MRLPLILCLLIPPSLAAQAPPLHDSLLVTTDWLATHLEDPSLVVLEVGRDSAAYAAGHLPGARFVPFAEVAAEQGGIPYELPDPPELTALFQRVGVPARGRVVICGEPLLAARLFFTLDYLGLGDRTALLDGGCSAWRAEGRPLSQETPAVTPTALALRPRPEVLADLARVAARLGDTTTALVDARMPDEFTGRTPGPDVLRPGHIPGARNFPWRFALDAAQPERLKEPAVLRALLARAGVTAGRPTTIYCRVGVQASLAYFVARYLGYAPRLYDGAFVEWSQRTELPVVRGP